MVTSVVSSPVQAETTCFKTTWGGGGGGGVGRGERDLCRFFLSTWDEIYKRIPRNAWTTHCKFLPFLV